MIFSAHSRTVIVEEAAISVFQYARNILNLPSWTSFFVKINQKEDERYRVETLMGSAISWIESQVTSANGDYQIDICTILNERVEKAFVYLHKVESETQVTFEVYLPSDWSSEKLNKQMCTVETELNNLKAILEFKRNLEEASNSSTLRDSLNCLDQATHLINTVR